MEEIDLSCQSLWVNKLGIIITAKYRVYRGLTFYSSCDNLHFHVKHWGRKKNNNNNDY